MVRCAPGDAVEAATGSASAVEAEAGGGGEAIPTPAYARGSISRPARRSLGLRLVGVLDIGCAAHVLVRRFAGTRTGAQIGPGRRIGRRVRLQPIGDLL